MSRCAFPGRSWSRKMTKLTAKNTPPEAIRDISGATSPGGGGGGLGVGMERLSVNKGALQLSFYGLCMMLIVLIHNFGQFASMDSLPSGSGPWVNESQHQCGSVTHTPNLLILQPGFQPEGKSSSKPALLKIKILHMFFLVENGAKTFRHLIRLRLHSFDQEHSLHQSLCL